MNVPVTLKNSVKAVLVIAALTFFAASCLQQARPADVTITATDREPPQVTRISDPSKDYSTFSHSIPEHKEVNCDSCHQREGGSTDLEYAGHASCIGCHMNEFTNPKSNLCVACHSDLQTVPPDMKPFPAHFREGFNMKFNHAAHLTGDGRPPEDCASCHRPAGASQTIPSGIDTHQNCMTCHTPESNIGSCSVCHELAPYQRARTTTAIINAVFSHSDHTFRQGVNCAECHTVRATTVRSQQVSAPVAVQHKASGAAVSCLTCHNDSRAFGDANFANCARCHTGPGFDMLP